MDTISQFGGELQELRAQLETFEKAAKNSNLELDGLRQRTDEDSAAVAQAGAHTKKALAGLDSALSSLRQKGSDSKERLHALVNTVQTQLRTTSDELKSNQAGAQSQLDAADARLRKGSNDLEQLEAALTGSEQHTQQSCQASLATLKAEGHSTEQLLNDSCQELQQKNQTIHALSEANYQELESHAARLGGEVAHNVGAHFKSVSDWLAHHVQQLHAVTFSQCTAISQGAFQNFETLGSGLTSQVAHALNQTFSAVMAGMQGSRQTVSNHLGQRTAPGLSSLLQAQLQVAETFEQGNQNAQKCSNNFPLLKQNVEILKRLANS
ncbi:MAG: hypothetical protein U0931_28385 [Vulcanimicrobiota bacterium]